MNRIKQFVVEHPYLTAYSIASVLLAARSTDFIACIGFMIIIGLVGSFVSRNMKL